MKEKRKGVVEGKYLRKWGDKKKDVDLREGDI